MPAVNIFDVPGAGTVRVFPKPTAQFQSMQQTRNRMLTTQPGSNILQTGPLNVSEPGKPPRSKSPESTDDSQKTANWAAAGLRGLGRLAGRLPSPAKSLAKGVGSTALNTVGGALQGGLTGYAGDVGYEFLTGRESNSAGSSAGMQLGAMGGFLKRPLSRIVGRMNPNSAVSTLINNGRAVAGEAARGVLPLAGFGAYGARQAEFLGDGETPGYNIARPLQSAQTAREAAAKEWALRQARLQAMFDEYQRRVWEMNHHKTSAEKQASLATASRWLPRLGRTIRGGLAGYGLDTAFGSLVGADSPLGGYAGAIAGAAAGGSGLKLPAGRKTLAGRVAEDRLRPLLGQLQFVGTATPFLRAGQRMMHGTGADGGPAYDVTRAYQTIVQPARQQQRAIMDQQNQLEAMLRSGLERQAEAHRWLRWFGPTGISISGGRPIEANQPASQVGMIDRRRI